MSCLHKREKGKLDKASTLSHEEKKTQCMVLVGKGRWTTYKSKDNIYYQICNASALSVLFLIKSIIIIGDLHILKDNVKVVCFFTVY